MKKIFFALVLVTLLSIGLGQPITALAAQPSLVTVCGTFPSVPTQSGKDMKYIGGVKCTTIQPQLSMSFAIYGEDGFWYGGQSRLDSTNVSFVSQTGIVNHLYVTMPAQKYRTQVCGWANNVPLVCKYSAWSARYVP